MKKGIVLIIVIGVMMIVFTLALVALYLRTQEARIAEHKIKRIRGVFAARAGMIHALEEIRKGNNPNGTAAITIGAGFVGYPALGLPVEVVYDAAITTGPGGTRPVSAMVDY